jgi:mevalonate kinase
MDDRRHTAIGTAPAKLILCGEHAVVYGRPAIALPLAGIRAKATVVAAHVGAGLRVVAPDLGRAWNEADAPDAPLVQVARSAIDLLAAPSDITITIRSAIPLSSGMGSGAAVATAIVRGVAAFAQRTLPAEDVSRLVYESERRFHGTPSGIDNAVVAFERPVWFQRLAAPQPPLIESVTIGAPLTLVVGDTGVRSATRLPVGDVRRRREEHPARYEALFDEVASLVIQARALLAAGDTQNLGPLLNANQALLEQIGVSSPELERLVAAARGAGAWGAKLSGAGWGGVMIALVPPEAAETVAAALRDAGATRVLVTSGR